MHGARRLTAVVLAASALWACQPGTSPIRALLPDAQAPVVVIPPGVASNQTSDQVAQRMLAEIAANERTLGRALAPARILRIQLLRTGETYWMKHFDGTNPDQSGMGTSDSPGWMVEAVGTFIGVDPQTGQIDSRGTHGFHLWEDAGGESWGFIPCWTRFPQPAEQLEGRC